MGTSTVSVSTLANGTSDVTATSQLVGRGTVPLWVYAGASGTTGWRTYASSSTNWLMVPNGTITTMEWLFMMLPGADNSSSYQLGTTSARWHTAWLARANVKTHAAFFWSHVRRETGAVQTTNNTPTAAYTSEGINDGTGTWVEIRFVARATASADRGMAVRRALVTREGGVTSVVAGSLQTIGTDSLPAGYAATIDVSGNTFRGMVTGTAATINWACSVEFQSVGNNT